MPRLKSNRKGHTYACPACDSSEIYERTGNGNARDDRPYLCENCSVSLHYVIHRPKKNFNHPQATLSASRDRRTYSRELEAMAPEDIGLQPIGVRGRP